MPTTLEVTNAIQDKVLDNVRVGQQAFVDCVQSWAHTVETAFTKLPELASAITPAKLDSVMGSTLAFTEQLLASQRDFAARVFEATMPATKAAQAAAQTVTNHVSSQAANTQGAAAQAARSTKA